MNAPERGMPEFSAEPLYLDRTGTVPAPPYDDGLPPTEIADDDVYADLDGVGPEQAMIDWEDTLITMREGGR